MRKYFVKALQLVLLACVMGILGGCSQFTEEVTEGVWKGRLSPEDKKAYVYSYTWDGTEEGLRIEAPSEISGCKVVQYGGHYGRGVPYYFFIDIPEGRIMSREDLPENAEVKELTFTLVIGENIKYLFLENNWELVCYSVWSKEDNCMYYYGIHVTPELDPANTKFAMYDGKLWEKDYEEKELEHSVDGLEYGLK